jgi:hypothetical protein
VLPIDPSADRGHLSSIDTREDSRRQSDAA